MDYTRERPKIDRIACPWLIIRFIDKEAESSILTKVLFNADMAFAQMPHYLRIPHLTVT
jgi:hypothetical protein